MNKNEQFEIRAYVFNRMTGMLAPGKDAWQGPSREERMEAWDKWNSEYGKIVNLMFDAMHYLEI